MEHFVGTKTVRLKGAHGKFLWAEDDHYTVSQHIEDKNERALWRVEIHKEGKEGIVRFKSCFDTYLAASVHHHHGISFLAFSGKRVVQMRSENVDSTTIFDWEPVKEQGILKLKSSVFGTYLRGNCPVPPWNDSVSHAHPRHEQHEGWLSWEVETVRAPNVIPLELIVGPIHEMKVDASYPDLSMWSKMSDNGALDQRKTPRSPHTASTRRRTRF